MFSFRAGTYVNYLIYRNTRNYQFYFFMNLMIYVNVTLKKKYSTRLQEIESCTEACQVIRTRAAPHYIFNRKAEQCS